MPRAFLITNKRYGLEHVIVPTSVTESCIDLSMASSVDVTAASCPTERSSPRETTSFTDHSAASLTARPVTSETRHRHLTSPQADVMISRDIIRQVTSETGMTQSISSYTSHQVMTHHGLTSGDENHGLSQSSSWEGVGHRGEKQTLAPGRGGPSPLRVVVSPRGVIVSPKCHARTDTEGIRGRGVDSLLVIIDGVQSHPSASAALFTRCEEDRNQGKNNDDVIGQKGHGQVRSPTHVFRYQGHPSVTGCERDFKEEGRAFPSHDGEGMGEGFVKERGYKVSGGSRGGSGKGEGKLYSVREDEVVKCENMNSDDEELFDVEKESESGMNEKDTKYLGMDEMEDMKDTAVGMNVKEGSSEGDEDEKYSEDRRIRLDKHLYKSLTEADISPNPILHADRRRFLHPHRRQSPDPLYRPHPLAPSDTCHPADHPTLPHHLHPPLLHPISALSRINADFIAAHPPVISPSSLPHPPPPHGLFPPRLPFSLFPELFGLFGAGRRLRPDALDDVSRNVAGDGSVRRFRDETAVDNFRVDNPAVAKRQFDSVVDDFSSRNGNLGNLRSVRDDIAIRYSGAARRMLKNYGEELSKADEFRSYDASPKERYYRLDHNLNELVERTTSTLAPRWRMDCELPQDVHACVECGKQYSTSSNLARHRQTHRTTSGGSIEGGGSQSQGSAPLRALHSLSNGSSSSASSLGEHRKPRKCPHCDKAYVSMPAYSMHVRTHNQGCACPHCGKRFSRPWLLQGHVRTHTGEKPFSCSVCGKHFADKSNLRAHVQTHSPDKPFVCGRCGKAFALKSYLYKHEESSCMRSTSSVVTGCSQQGLTSPPHAYHHQAMEGLRRAGGKAGGREGGGGGGGGGVGGVVRGASGVMGFGLLQPRKQ